MFLLTDEECVDPKLLKKGDAPHEDWIQVAGQHILVHPDLVLLNLVQAVDDSIHYELIGDLRISIDCSNMKSAGLTRLSPFQKYLPLTVTGVTTEPMAAYFEFLFLII